jgi:hypothetical protein
MSTTKINPETGEKNPVPENLKAHVFKKGDEWQGNALGNWKGTKHRLRKTAEALQHFEAQSPADVFIYIRDTALANGDLNLAMNANKELSKFVESTADAKESNKTPPSAAREMTAKELKAKLRKFKIA